MTQLDHGWYKEEPDPLPDPLLDNTPDVNVFLKLRNKSGMSHVTFGKEVHVSKQALIRLEQGMFETPLVPVMEYWERKGYSQMAMLDEYEQFQEVTRRSNHLLLGPDLHIDLTSHVHPLEQLRKRVSTPGQGISAPVGRYAELNKTQFAKRLCIPQSTVQRWETTWHSQKTVPKCIQLALMQAGYQAHQIRSFNDSYYLWRDLQSKRRGVTLVR